jgi:hypothetical protein
MMSCLCAVGRGMAGWLASQPRAGEFVIVIASTVALKRRMGTKCSAVCFPRMGLTLGTRG